jgi:hypothetical protein
VLCSLLTLLLITLFFGDVQLRGSTLLGEKKAIIATGRCHHHACCYVQSLVSGLSLITVATGEDDLTSPVATEDQRGNG